MLKKILGALKMANNFGCIYTKMGKHHLCRKIPGVTKISPECQIQDQHCLEKSTNRSKFEIIESPKFQTPPRLSQVQPTNLVPPKTINISGVISVMKTDYDGKRYYFFSDRHFSTEKSCPEPCQTFNLSTKKRINEHVNNCYEIGSLIDAMIKSSRGYTDIYFETPFLTQNHTTHKNFAQNIAPVGYLSKTVSEFYPCLTKGEDCLYANARFHYIDLRLASTLTYPISISLDTYIFSTLLQNSLKKIELNSQDENYIRDFNQLVTYFYVEQANGKTRAQELFDLMLESLDYVSDVQHLIGSLNLKNASIKNHLSKVLFNPALIVTRGEYQLHRIGAQFYGLVQDGKAELASQIINYLKRMYSIKRPSQENIRVWFTIYNAYIQHSNELMAALNHLKANSINYYLAEALLVDAYTMGRMFRSFRNTQHIESNKVMLYAGSAHIDLISAFFADVLGSKLDVEPYYGNELFLSRCVSAPRDWFF